MREIFFYGIWLFITMSCTRDKENVNTTRLRLWYDKPAEKWVEALPLGNGRIGAMVYGSVVNEHIQFNEETLWTGRPHDYAHSGAYSYLPLIRKYLDEGKQKEAEDTALEKFMSVPLRQTDYQPFGDLIISFPDHDDFSGYHRELDLEKAMVSVNYISGGNSFSRKYFVSEPHQLLVAHLSSERKRSLSFTVKLQTPHKQKSSVLSLNDSEIMLRLKVEDGALEGCSRIKILRKGGTIHARGDSMLVVRNASEATLFLSAATNFIDPHDVSGDPGELSSMDMIKVRKLSYPDIEKAHIREYQDYFKRFSLEFASQSKDTLPVDRRILMSVNDPDPSLAALYVQYGRYLLIASSRPGTYPANLQGIWNQELRPPWGSKYTVNINTEMNYWPAEVLNLPECHEPLFRLITEVSQTGQNTARQHYNARGWVLHHNTDLWRGAAPINASNHGIWVTGGAWLCHHLWEHYLFTQDRNFLVEVYPIIRDAAVFFTDFLVKDRKTGWLISTPSNSPENGGLVAGPTMDHAIIRSLFKITVLAAGIIGTDNEFRDTLSSMIPQIAPFQVGKYAQLQEWLEDRDDTANKHRHVSHLWAVHPGTEITWKDAPEMMKAARQSLIYRGDEATGWSLAWKINFWARFRDGEHAYKMINMLLRPAEIKGHRSGAGSYPNLFDAHPPFQIDGNFGAAAGVVEMLIQSHQGEIELLPALPSAFSSGKITGVRARDGFELDFSWENSRITGLTIKSLAGRPLRIRYNGIFKEMETSPGQKITLV